MIVPDLVRRMGSTSSFLPVSAYTAVPSAAPPLGMDAGERSLPGPAGTAPPADSTSTVREAERRWRKRGSARDARSGPWV